MMTVLEYKRRMTNFQPAAGQVVHFIRPDGKHCAALIVDVNPLSSQFVNVVVFQPESGRQEFYSNARYDKELKEPNTWHYTEQGNR